MIYMYWIKTQCDNCEKWFETKIPKGTTVLNYRAEHEDVQCTICECKTVLNTENLLS